MREWGQRIVVEGSVDGRRDWNKVQDENPSLVDTVDYDLQWDFSRRSHTLRPWPSNWSVYRYSWGNVRRSHHTPLKIKWLVDLRTLKVNHLTHTMSWSLRFLVPVLTYYSFRFDVSPKLYVEIVQKIRVQSRDNLFLTLTLYTRPL